MSVTSSKTLLAKPCESIVTDKHYWNQIASDMGINASIRIDKHNSTLPQNTAGNT